jgi:hypothetical protein
MPRNIVLAFENKLFYPPRMNEKEFNDCLAKLGLPKLEVAQLLGVTLRAVNFWSAGSREVPPPAIAYLRLLSSLPSALRAQELARLKEAPMMLDGMYLVEYVGREGTGTCVIVLMDGIAFGHDSQVIYDGVYAPNEKRAGWVDLKLRLTVPPGVALVQGVPAQPAEYRFDLAATIPARGSARLQVTTPYGPVNCNIRFLRALPVQLAA